MKSYKYLFTYSILTLTLSCTNTGVDIHSYILRDRVVLLDHVLMKKALYVGFSVSGRAAKLNNVKVNGTFSCNTKKLSEAYTVMSNERTGNLVFDLPYQIPDGKYKMELDVFEDGNLISKDSLTVERTALKSAFKSKKKKMEFPREEIISPLEPLEYTIKREDQSVGYIIFSRSPLEYVFPGSRPKESEIINSLSIIAVKNEFEPITFSVYPLRELGKVEISIANLTEGSNSISRDKIEIACVESVQATVGLPQGTFQNLPCLIRPGNEIEVLKGKTQRFWLTIRVDDTVLPGQYKGTVTISPQNGMETSLPIEVTVVPITLEDIPHVDYFMLMTYELTELTMPWNETEKIQIYQSAVKILEDYRAHGMTTLCPHSPFVFIKNDDGTPNLPDIFANLIAARDVGFTRPLIWYMGYLIQTSKPKHPGNIIGFEEDVHLPRLKSLVTMVSQYAKDNNCPAVVFLPIDEPDDAYQDYKGKRREITNLLLKTIKERGAKTALTAGNYNQFTPVDYFCTSQFSREDLPSTRDNNSAYLLYNNAVATNCTNPVYARYIYGHYTWRNNINGMCSWTFQNTQNASGLPAMADCPGNDIYLAYPDPKGPLATLRWEAVREGIDDHKLIHQLTKRTRKLRENGIDISKYERFVADIGEKQGAPGLPFGHYRGWSPTFFEKTRENLISMIVEADKLLCGGAL